MNESRQDDVLLASLLEAHGDFAAMTAEATRLESLLERDEGRECDAALRIAYLEERVLELQLALRAVRLPQVNARIASAASAGYAAAEVRAIEETLMSRPGETALECARRTIRDAVKLGGVLGASARETVADAAARVVRERDAALAELSEARAANQEFRSSIGSVLGTTDTSDSGLLGAAERGPVGTLKSLSERLRRSGLVADARSWSAIDAGLEVVFKTIDGIEGRIADARKQERDIRDAEMKVIHGKLLQHGATMPPVAMTFDAVMAGIRDLGDRASRTLPGSVARAEDSRRTIERIAGALGWDAGVYSDTDVIQGVRDVRIGRDNAISRVRALRDRIAAALGISPGHISDEALVSAVDEARIALADARARNEEAMTRLAGFPGMSVADRVRNLLVEVVRLQALVPATAPGEGG